MLIFILILFTIQSSFAQTCSSRTDCKSCLTEEPASGSTRIRCSFNIRSNTCANYAPTKRSVDETLQAQLTAQFQCTSFNQNTYCSQFKTCSACTAYGDDVKCRWQTDGRGCMHPGAPNPQRKRAEITETTACPKTAVFVTPSPPATAVINRCAIQRTCSACNGVAGCGWCQRQCRASSSTDLRRCPDANCALITTAVFQRSFVEAAFPSRGLSLSAGCQAISDCQKCQSSSLRCQWSNGRCQTKSAGSVTSPFQSPCLGGIKAPVVCSAYTGDCRSCQKHPECVYCGWIPVGRKRDEVEKCGAGGFCTNRPKNTELKDIDFQYCPFAKDIAEMGCTNFFYDCKECPKDFCGAHGYCAIDYDKGGDNFRCWCDTGYTGEKCDREEPVYIKVHGVEVTQGFQNYVNSVPIIADRETYVRVAVQDGGFVPPPQTRLPRVGDEFKMTASYVGFPDEKWTISGFKGVITDLHDSSIIFKLPSHLLKYHAQGAASERDGGIRSANKWAVKLEFAVNEPTVQLSCDKCTTYYVVSVALGPRKITTYRAKWRRKRSQSFYTTPYSALYNAISDLEDWYPQEFKHYTSSKRPLGKTMKNGDTSTAYWLAWIANKAIWNSGDHMLIPKEKPGYEAHGSVWPFLSWGFCYFNEAYDSACPHEYGHANKRRHVKCEDNINPMKPHDTNYPFRDGRIFARHDIDNLPVGNGDYHHMRMSTLRLEDDSKRYDVMSYTCSKRPSVYHWAWNIYRFADGYTDPYLKPFIQKQCSDQFGGCGGHTSYDRKRQVSNFTITGLKAVSLGGYGETFGPGVVIEGVLNLSQRKGEIRSVRHTFVNYLEQDLDGNEGVSESEATFSIYGRNVNNTAVVVKHVRGTVRPDAESNEAFAMDVGAFVATVPWHADVVKLELVQHKNRIEDGVALPVKRQPRTSQIVHTLQQDTRCSLDTRITKAAIVGEQLEITYSFELLFSTALVIDDNEEVDESLEKPTFDTFGKDHRIIVEYVLKRKETDKK